MCFLNVDILSTEMFFCEGGNAVSENIFVLWGNATKGVI